MNKHTHFITGKWLAGEGHDIQSVDPAKKEIIWQAKSASQEQVDAAVKAARLAFVAWSSLTLTNDWFMSKNLPNYSGKINKHLL